MRRHATGGGIATATISRRAAADDADAEAIAGLRNSGLTHAGGAPGFRGQHPAPRRGKAASIRCRHAPRARRTSVLSGRTADPARSPRRHDRAAASPPPVRPPARPSSAGVSPVGSLWSAFAPALSSSSTIGALPLATARLSGLMPRSVSALASAPALSSLRAPVEIIGIHAPVQWPACRRCRAHWDPASVHRPRSGVRQQRSRERHRDASCSEPDPPDSAACGDGRTAHGHSMATLLLSMAGLAWDQHRLPPPRGTIVRNSFFALHRRGLLTAGAAMAAGTLLSASAAGPARRRRSRPQTPAPPMRSCCPDSGWKG